jgi:GNAT superfamily N-acetyltransferase
MPTSAIAAGRAIGKARCRVGRSDVLAARRGSTFDAPQHCTWESWVVDATPPVTVSPATDDRFDDVAALLAPRRLDAPACWCLAYRVTSSENNRLRGEDRPARLRSFFGNEIAPGVIAYDNDEPVGWCAFGPRSEMGRLQRSKTIPQVDDRPVVSIVCFVVRADHRRQGVARTMLEAATDYLRAHGVRTLEAYPIDNDGRKISSAFAYVGTVPLFESCGFVKSVITSSATSGMPRWVMRKDL